MKKSWSVFSTYLIMSKIYNLRYLYLAGHFWRVPSTSSLPTLGLVTFVYMYSRGIRETYIAK